MPVVLISPAQASSDEYFILSTAGSHTGQWLCKLCTGRMFKDKIRHSKLKTHVDRVRLELERIAAAEPAAAPPGLGPRSPLGNRQTLLAAPMFPEDDPVEEVAEDQNAHNQNAMDIFQDGVDSSSDGLESLYDPSHPIKLGCTSGESSVDLEEMLDGSDSPGCSSQAVEPKQAATDTWLPWYPLQKAEVVRVPQLLIP
ncbi:uncharacterized protein MELLADRAFT_106414 [Melampsora larici-populina 98AG31]|uniref:Uncharacterized protein n=1 Tax=Melampsora larici-populina (strain 98AG31 / pathotype 3-4-7) TaxID=747676 RepID=F4RLB0_MELLP|nr:uncharacterized protein MELLADRAFT_106414 [Melampsora larici-populina 98AG31]EGG06903.1 hypothetical protein MELLADRAFT_106414 [Melampsora larici-populina 98AG31]